MVESEMFTLKAFQELQPIKGVFYLAEVPAGEKTGRTARISKSTVPPRFIFRCLCYHPGLFTRFTFMSISLASRG